MNNILLGSMEIHHSSIEGTGVFAAHSIGRGDAVLKIDDSRVVDDQHPLSSDEDPRHCDYLAAGKVVLMPSPERYINHSCDPNTYVKTVDGIRVVIALRPIAAGQEITYDYCINGDGDTLWVCHCGASRCRHVIHSDFFHLAIELQREYLPLLDDWFRRERASEIEWLAHTPQ
jgi:SET domain-containing protein